MSEDAHARLGRVDTTSEDVHGCLESVWSR